MKKLNIVAAQINPTVGDLKANAKLIIKTAEHARDKLNADIILFPELALSGYPPEDLLFRRGFYARAEKALQEVLTAVNDVAMIIGYPACEKDQFYNRAAFIDKGKIIATYDKRDLPNYTVFDEKRYFTPGKKDCVVDYKGLKIGIVICEDIWYPKCSASTVKAGAQIILSPNASPYDFKKVRARETMLIERAHEVNVPLVYCNLVGGQDELVFDGGSMVVSAEGERVQQAAYYKEDYMAIEVTLEKPIKITPQTLPPHLTSEENIYKTLVLGCHDYVKKNQFKGVIIGLSGGIDSALTLAIASDALGAKNVTAVMMPSRYTAKMSIEDAEAQAKKLGVNYQTIDIEPIFKTYLTALKPLFQDKDSDKTEENIQSRIRGNLLMALSNKFGDMVLCTGNRSEYAVGYATLYGDMAGGFALLKDIPKTLVYKLVEYRNSTNEVIPARVIEREPSAELAENQRDQDTLPAYKILDDILELYINEDKSPEEIYQAGFDKKIVSQIIKLINLNEYKRRQSPVGIRITQSAFGKDRRYPITSGYWRNI
ncbi:MAG: NAD+ synthase [Gammaproteobacteria bacterium]|nr:NAD+ synthase [Gammaproteobacteria bacterium]